MVAVDAASRLLVPDYGVGGFADAGGRILLAVDPTLDLPPEELLRRLHGAVLHESMHVVQGFTKEAWEGKPLPALDHAVYEGCATVFERERAGTDPPWGHYVRDQTMLAWAGELAALPLDYDWAEWKFWHPEKRQPWILYRTGTFVVDRALAAAGLEIEDLAALSAAEIAGRAPR